MARNASARRRPTMNAGHAERRLRGVGALFSLLNRGGWEWAHDPRCRAPHGGTLLRSPRGQYWRLRARPQDGLYLQPHWMNAYETD